MSEINDFSKRFLADFIAARLKAVRVEKDRARRMPPGVEPSHRAGETPACKPKTADPRPGDVPPIEPASRLRPGLGSSN